ncbi:MAG: hypothetical protein WKF34_11615 [Pyrinomonadaceae bacterium]
MTYIIVILTVLMLYAFARRALVHGAVKTLIDAGSGAISGWIAGILIGIGARVGMWTIPFANGTASRASLEGSLQVVLVFSLFGIGLGLLYELLFRSLFRRRGVLYGLLITIVTAYPIGSAGFQQLEFPPSPAGAVASSLFFAGLMFIPFAIANEYILTLIRRVRIRGKFASTSFSLTQ